MDTKKEKKTFFVEDAKISIMQSKILITGVRVSTLAGELSEWNNIVHADRNPT